MKSILPVIILMILCLDIAAQLTSPITVKAGEDLYKKLEHEIYLYPAFVTGTVLFRDGRVNQANLNYNFLIGEMQFINDKGDTLSLANELTIKHICIVKDSFFYSEGYLQLVAANESAKIARKQIIKIVDQQKIGAYDQPNSAGAVTSYSSMSNSLKNFSLDVRQDVILAKQTTFFIADRFNNFSRANKKNLLKAFRKKENVLNDYFKNNNVDFNKEEDLVKMIAVLKD